MPSSAQFPGKGKGWASVMAPLSVFHGTLVTVPRPWWGSNFTDVETETQRSLVTRQEGGAELLGFEPETLPNP